MTSVIDVSLVSEELAEPLRSEAWLPNLRIH